MGATQQVLASYGASFVPALDPLAAQGATFIRVYSVQRLLTLWDGDCGTITSDTGGNPATSVGFLADGSMDVATANGFAAGNKFWTTWNDQTGTVDATAALATAPWFSSDIFAGGALGGSTGHSTASLVAGNQNFTTMPFVWMVVRQGVALSAALWTSTATRILSCNATMVANFGANVTVASGVATNTYYSLGFRSSSGSNVELQVNNTTLKSQASSTTALAWAGSRIGSASTGASSWWTNSGSLILEIIGFGSDPRGLAGWSDFVANRHAYFGI